MSKGHDIVHGTTSILQSSKGNNIKKTKRTIHPDSGNQNLQAKKQGYLQEDFLIIQKRKPVWIFTATVHPAKGWHLQGNQTI